MNYKRISSIVVILIGIALLIFSAYIKNKLADAEGQISSAKSKVDTGEKLFSLNPVSKEIGEGLTGSAREKIRDAEGQVAYYYEVAMWCQRGGIALIIIGAAVFIFSRKKGRK